MRRLAASLIGILLAVAAASIAAAQPLAAEHETGAMAYRAVLAHWTDIESDRINYYNLSIYEHTVQPPDRVMTYDAQLVVTSCERKKPRGIGACAFKDPMRLRVVSFEMDPLLLSARVVAERNGRTAEVTWSGNEIDGSPAGSYASHSIYGPTEVEGYANLWAGLKRKATARGDLFGAPMQESGWAEMYQWIFSDQSICAGEPTCDGGERAGL